MKTNSIYTNNPLTAKNKTPKEFVARMAMEVTTIENLQTLGFTHSNGQNLKDRKMELETIIQQIMPSPVGGKHA